MRVYSVQCTSWSQTTEIILGQSITFANLCNIPNKNKGKYHVCLESQKKTQTRLEFNLSIQLPNSVKPWSWQQSYLIKFWPKSTSLSFQHALHIQIQNLKPNQTNPSLCRRACTDTTYILLRSTPCVTPTCTRNLNLNFSFPHIQMPVTTDSQPSTNVSHAMLCGIEVTFRLEVTSGNSSLISPEILHWLFPFNYR